MPGWTAVSSKANHKPKKEKVPAHQTKDDTVRIVKNATQSKLKPGQPVGATVLDPREEKVRLKAVEALKRQHQHQQTRCEKGDVITSEVKKENIRKLEEASKKATALANKVQQAHVVVHATETTTPTLHIDPVATYIVLPSERNVAIKVSYTGERQHHKAPPQPSSKQEAVGKLAADNTSNPATLGLCTPVIVLPTSTKSLRLEDKNTINVVVQELTKFPAAPLRTGMLVAVDGKFWCDGTTMDEPWMFESYFKALLSILRKEKTSVSAYPFWPVHAGPHKDKNEIAEAEVVLTLSDDGGFLKLEHKEHHCAVRVPLKSCTVPVVDFSKGLVKTGLLLVELHKALELKLPAAVAQKVLPRFGTRIAHLVEELSSILLERT